MKFCECRPAVVYLSFFVLLYFFSSSYLVNFIKIVFYLYLYYSICICICSIIIVFVCALVFVSYFLDGVNGLLCRPASHSCSPPFSQTLLYSSCFEGGYQQPLPTSYLFLQLNFTLSMLQHLRNITQYHFSFQSYFTLGPSL